MVRIYDHKRFAWIVWNIGWWRDVFIIMTSIILLSSVIIIHRRLSSHGGSRFWRHSYCQPLLLARRLRIRQTTLYEVVIDIDWFPVIKINGSFSVHGTIGWRLGVELATILSKRCDVLPLLFAHSLTLEVSQDCFIGTQLVWGYLLYIFIHHVGSCSLNFIRVKLGYLIVGHHIGLNIGLFAICSITTNNHLVTNNDCLLLLLLMMLRHLTTLVGIDNIFAWDTGTTWHHGEGG